ncbi:putative disease resistance protein RGA4 [Citrus clementina]|uniref:putative disease resistance protein RGA4 n=1 Tax=Citrus clementina TaxID=85681 RepID=UPI000CECFC4C|nr:putative disease resistance protein RGA4 [Citrus x clementina]
MVDAIVSSLLEQLISVAADEAKQQVRLVTSVREEVKKLTSNLQAIRAVLEDAEQRQMQQDKVVTFWLDQLKDASYDMEDVLDEWVFTRLKLQIEGVDDDNAFSLAPHKKKVRSFFRAVSNCFGSFKQLGLRQDIAVKIREINEKPDDIASQKDRFKFVENVSNHVKKPKQARTTSLIDEGEVCGRVDEKNELLSKLLFESSEQQKGLHVISLVGLGGMDTFEEIRVANAIIEGLERLPKTLCELYNLQKLDIRWCEDLRELPAGIGKLKNMRSLLNGGTPSLKYMPIGISKLTSLRTLEKFAMGGGVNDISTCRLESLKNLQLLRECGIEGLSNVSHLDEDERLGLHNMKNLLRLSLEFDEEGEEGRRKNQQLLEALQPPLNVKELGIVSHGGNIFPKWLTSLTNLRDLRLKSCVICEHFPPLGKLPLEKLTLYGLYGVKRVGNEFLGIEGSSEDDPSSSSSSSSVIAFPKLKSLHIGAMEELEEWNYRITRKENISIMPRLSSLTIWYCPRLRVLLDYLFQSTTLQKLSISYCPIMEELRILEDHRTTDIPRLSSLEIEYCPKLKVLPDYLLRRRRCSN